MGKKHITPKSIHTHTYFPLFFHTRKKGEGIYVCCVYLFRIYILVVMRNTCQVTNQSSHGELSFHHNPHLRLCWGLGLFTSRVVRSGGSRLKNAALPTYCHCCEFCALKQKPGVLLENKKKRLFEKKTHTVFTHTCVREKERPRRARARAPSLSLFPVCVFVCRFFLEYKHVCILHKKSQLQTVLITASGPQA